VRSCLSLWLPLRVCASASASVIACVCFCFCVRVSVSVSLSLSLLIFLPLTLSLVCFFRVLCICACPSTSYSQFESLTLWVFSHTPLPSSSIHTPGPAARGRGVFKGFVHQKPQMRSLRKHAVDLGDVLGHPTECSHYVGNKQTLTVGNIIRVLPFWPPGRKFEKWGIRGRSWERTVARRTDCSRLVVEMEHTTT
jgi:hypothetical protein